MIVVISALVAVVFIPTGNDAAQKQLTLERMEKIEAATISFMARNARRPCPANGSYHIDEANFGVEAANPGTCTGGTPSASFGPDSSGFIVGGVVPTKSLGLNDELAFDGWGRRFTYVVDKRATVRSTCLPLATGNIAVNNEVGGLLSHAMAITISHGRDAHGAFPIQGAAAATRINTNNTDTATLLNASLTSGFTTAFGSSFVKKDQTTSFDDVVYYSDTHKNQCCAGPLCETDCALPWGGTISTSSSVTAFQASSVDSPATCVSESRNCSLGTLSGTYTNENCVVNCAINQRPSFTGGANIVITVPLANVNIPNWATNINPGAACESWQTLTFEVTANSTPLMFSIPPAVSASGTLTFKPTLVPGVATVTVRLKDNGGTAGGGQDTSTNFTFLIIN